MCVGGGVVGGRERRRRKKNKTKQQTKLTTTKKVRRGGNGGGGGGEGAGRSRYRTKPFRGGPEGRHTLWESGEKGRVGRLPTPARSREPEPSAILRGELESLTMGSLGAAHRAERRTEPAAPPAAALPRPGGLSGCQARPAWGRT